MYFLGVPRLTSLTSRHRKDLMSAMVGACVRLVGLTALGAISCLCQNYLKTSGREIVDAAIGQYALQA